MKLLIASITSLALIASPLSAQDTNNDDFAREVGKEIAIELTIQSGKKLIDVVTKPDVVKAGGAALAGGALGGATVVGTGTVGMAAGGTALSVAAAPVVVAGAVIGLVGYGIYRIFN